LKDVGKIYNKLPAEIEEGIKRLHKRYDLDASYSFNHWRLTSRTKELTSRIESTKIKKILDELEQSLEIISNDTGNVFPNSVDLVLASNMFSVGIDIERLNVMLMNGQPKNIAEYIQVSSRVGRKYKGIVISLLDANRSREKSYFENYVAFNSTYYKFVEPLSVTPFTETALDKVLASVLICFIRHKKGIEARDYKGDYQELIDFLNNRIKNQVQREYALSRLEKLSNDWLLKKDVNINLQYKDSKQPANGLIKDSSEFDEWSIMMSMREIDTNSIIKIIQNDE
jgi:superfamily II DNA/RNA helicase